MTFRFRLEKVLHFIRLRETVKKMEVSAIAQRLRFLEDRKVMLGENIRALLARQSESPNSGWEYFQNNKVSVDVKEVTQLERMIEQEKKYLEKKRDELNRLYQKKRALEALREKKNKEFRLEESHRQQAQADEAYQLSRGKRC